MLDLARREAYRSEINLRRQRGAARAVNTDCLDAWGSILIRVETFEPHLAGSNLSESRRSPLACPGSGAFRTRGGRGRSEKEENGENQKRMSRKGRSEDRGRPTLAAE